MTNLKFCFLGSPFFTLDEVLIRIGRRKAVALAAFITITGKSHSRERLADLLWPDYSRERARSSLRRTLSVLTKSLGQFWLTIDRDNIGFISHKNLRVDVLRFRELIATSSSDPTYLAALEEAAALCSGSFLAGFTLKDCPDFDDWQFEQAEALCREGSLIQERLSAQYMQRGEYPRAIHHTLNWVKVDPLNEAAHRQLIRLYHLTGQPWLALRQYEKCKARLQKDLGVAPDERTLALAVEIRTKQPVVQQEASLPLTNLPAQLTRFIGRKQEVKNLVSLIGNPGVRLLTLTGPGGIGKTRLALEAAKYLEATPELTNPFPQGVFFLSVLDLFSVEVVVRAFFKIFGLSANEKRDPLGQIIGFLAPRKILLVLDNLESLPEVGELVSKILTEAPGLKILATSRIRLMLKGEHLFPLSGLQYPSMPPTALEPADIIETEEKYDAIALFLSSARMLRPKMELNADNIHGIVRICKLTQGMPLALILAAGWMEVFPPIKIADEIQKSLGFLKSDLRDLHPNHQNMRAVFDSSWKRLPTNEQEIFTKLSVFRDGFTMDAATAVLDGGRNFIASIVTSLLRKSMLNVNPDAGYFEIHPLLRQYAREKLAQSGLVNEMLDAHANHYLEQVQYNESRLIGDGMLACRQEMDDAFANIHQAWLWAVDQGNLNTLARAAPSLYDYFDMHTRYHEGEALFRPAKELLMGMWEPDMNPEAGVILLCWFDMQVQSLSSRDQSQSSVETLQEITMMAQAWRRVADKCNSIKAKAFSLMLMGAITHTQSQYIKAIRFFRLSLEQDPGIEHSFWCYIRIGLCWLALGKMKLAIKNFWKSHEIGYRLGDAVKRAWSLKNIGAAEISLGDLETAEQCLRSAEASFEQIEAPIGLVISREELGWLAFLKGNFTLAFSMVDQAIKMSMDLCLALSQYQNVQVLKGFILVAEGDQDQGEVCLEEVLKTGVPHFTAHLAMVFSSYLKGKRSEAECHLKSAVKMVSSEHKPQLKVLLLLASAAVACQAGDDAQSCKLLSRAFHHPGCPIGLFKTWEFPGNLSQKLKSGMTPDQFDNAWEIGRSLK